VTIVDPVIPSRRRVAVIGHRGSRATHAENTIAAFQHACDVGADAVELDVTLSRDGVLTVSHNRVLCDFARLPTGTPCIEQVVEFARGNSLFFDVEVKWYSPSPVPGEEYARLLMTAITPLAGRVAVRSFHHRLLRGAHDIAPEVPLIALTRRSAIRWAQMAKRARARAISPHHWLITPGEVRRAHKAGLPVYAWTVNREEDWRRMLRVGVDGIITDDPAALAAFLDREAPVTQAASSTQANRGVTP
jgi:glycerophosphoryl diester phosphodiesterase